MFSLFILKVFSLPAWLINAELKKYESVTCFYIFLYNLNLSYHDTFSQECLNLLHKENGIELNQAEHRIQEMGSTSTRFASLGRPAVGPRPWCQSGAPGPRRGRGPRDWEDRWQSLFWNMEILKYSSSNNEQLRRRLVQYFCWWLFVWDISYVWTVAVKTGGSLTCWRQKLLGTVAGGFPLVTGVKIPRRERNVGKFPQIFRAKVGRTKNMKIPAVLTSVCNTVIVSIFGSFNLCIIPLSLFDISINVSVWRGSHSLSVKSKCSVTNVPTCN